MAHILIIDDDGGIRSFLQRVFEMKGHAVTTAANGLDALRVFNRSVDLVITDMLMPHMDGLETIRCLKKLAPGLPMIAISGGGGFCRETISRRHRPLGRIEPWQSPSRFWTCRMPWPRCWENLRRAPKHTRAGQVWPAAGADGWSRTAQRRLPHAHRSNRCAAAADFPSGLAGKRSAAPVKTRLRGSRCGARFTEDFGFAWFQPGTPRSRG